MSCQLLPPHLKRSVTGYRGLKHVLLDSARPAIINVAVVNKNQIILVFGWALAVKSIKYADGMASEIDPDPRANSL